MASLFFPAEAKMALRRKHGVKMAHKVRKEARARARVLRAAAKRIAEEQETAAAEAAAAQAAWAAFMAPFYDEP